MTVQAKWYSIRRKTAIAAAAIGALAAAEVLIYGDIGESYWEETVSAASFVKEFAAIDASDITVRINSYGGSVTDGVAIYNAITRHKAFVTVEIDGMAFSIASLIAMAGDKVHMAANAMLMVHAPWTLAIGNSVEMREVAGRLDAWSAAMSTSYAVKTGRPQAEMLALLTDGKDHYYTADEALAEKFIDAITDAAPPTAMAVMRGLDLKTRYRDVPAAWLQACGASPAAASAAAPFVAAATQLQENEMLIKRHASLAAAAVLMAAAADSGSVIHGTGTAAADAAAAAMPGAVSDAQRAEVLAADTSRRAGIAASFKPFLAREGVADLLARLQSDHSTTVEAAGTRLLAFLGAGSEPIAGGRVITVEAEADKIRNAQVNVLLARGNVVGADRKPVVIDTGNPFRGHTLLDLAKASLARAGLRTEGLDKMGIVAMAFTNTSSDFPILLENVMHKALQAAYATQPMTWNRWAKTGTVSDFRAHNRYRKGSFGVLDTVLESAEFKNKSVPDGEKARITATTKGNIVNLSRQAIINDDLSAFLGIAQDLGAAAGRTVEADAIAMLVSNPTLVQDNVALFHATHANLGTAAVNSVASWDEGRVLMARQPSVGGNDFLDLRPAVWLGPTALGGLARVINDAQYDPDTANKLQMPNRVRGLVRDVIDTPRLTGTAWYLLADKDECPIVEVAFLDGNQTPYLELEQGFTVDGARWKVRLDYGVAAVDFRGAVRNAGA